MFTPRSIRHPPKYAHLHSARPRGYINVTLETIKTQNKRYKIQNRIIQSTPFAFAPYLFILLVLGTHELVVLVETSKGSRWWFLG